MSLSPGTRLGPYEIEAPIGEGAMGQVYQAVDTRLGRAVAVKILPPELASDAGRRERFEREARAASSLNHPHICALFDIGEQDDLSFLVMERLEGETLAERLERGPLDPVEAVDHALTLLDTLGALHERQLVHRDIKPSNVFLTQHGLKLLDFGLARSARPGADDTQLDLTQPGMILGTPRYMAPEAIRGTPVDARADVYAVGALLYEMLAGAPAFQGDTLIDVAHAVLHDNPPILGGSGTIVAIDRVVHKAIAKDAADRFPAASDMARALRSVEAGTDVAPSDRAVRTRRLIVLPFRMLRQDEDADFLAFSLPDAIATSLSGLQSLVVRSTMSGEAFAKGSPDLKAIARELEVDLVVAGTLLRVGDEIQVTAQLVEAPAGTVLWSDRSQAPWRDVFRVQDELARRIVESLAVPLSARERDRMDRDAPASASAYELYLRANRIARVSSDWPIARDLYQRCVEADPAYAPAWVGLARMHRLIAKFVDVMDERTHADGYDRAKEAFDRAFELNPDLPLAHSQFTHYELERGQPLDAMVRLIGHARATPTDAHAFAGLVGACRYCGLLDASVAAHQEARRIERRIPTSVVFTHLWAGDYEAAIASTTEGWGDHIPKLEALIRLGRTDEAIALARPVEAEQGAPVVLRRMIQFLRLLAEDRLDGIEEFAEPFLDVALRQFDPESPYILSLYLARIGNAERALRLLRHALSGGFACYAGMLRDPWFESIRDSPDFQDMLEVAKARHDRALEALEESGGFDVLGC